MRLIRCDYPGCGWEAEKGRPGAAGTRIVYAPLRSGGHVALDTCAAHRNAEDIDRAAEAVAARIAKEGKE